MDDLSALRVVDLKEELKKLNLPVAGKKAELLERLKEALESTKEEQEDGAEEEEDKNKADVPLESEEGDQKSKKVKSSSTKGNPASERADEELDASLNEDGKEAQDLEDKATEPNTTDAAEQTNEPKTDEHTLQAASSPTPEAAGAESGANLKSQERAGPSPEQLLAEAEQPEKTENNKAEEKAEDAVMEVAKQEEEAIGEAKQEVEAMEVDNSTEDKPSTLTQGLAPMQAALLAPQTSTGEAVGVADAEEIAVDFEAEDAEEAPSAPEKETKEEPTREKTAATAAPSDEPVSKRQKQDTPGASGRAAESDPEPTQLTARKSKREPIPMFKPKRVREDGPVRQSPQEQSDGQKETGSSAKGSSVFQRLGSTGGETPVKGPGAPPSRITPTRALLVTGFVRPFRVPDVKALFQRHGNVSQFWMSSVRDKAYIVFETVEGAEAARQAVHSLEWPEGMRTSLRPKFIAVEEAESVISSNGSTLPARKSIPDVTAAAAKHIPTPTPPAATGNSLSRKPSTEAKEPEQKPLEELFRQTVFAPRLFWLPVGDERIKIREKSVMS